MNDTLRMFILAVGVMFFAVSLLLLMRKKLSEKIAIVWFFGIFAVLVLSVFPQLLNELSDDLGIDYPPSLLYLIAILVLFFYNLYQSMKIVEIQRQVKEISQVISLSHYRAPDSSSTQLPADQNISGKENDGYRA